MTEPVEVIRAGVLAGVAHGFLGRRGGVSTGLAAGLNAGLGAGDDPTAVAENRVLATRAVLAGAALVTPYQVHGADAVTLFAAPTDGARPRADALVTDVPGLLLGVVTADCAPVLLHDAHAGVMGAAHAGWRGALGGVVEATLLAMEARGAVAGRIAAAVGPCIGQASYEVDDAFRDRFLAVDPATGRHFIPGGPGRHQFDLAGYVGARLAAAGVATVELLGLDTYADAARFFSYRRATHRGEGGYGRQLSLIGLAAAAPPR